MARRPYFDPQIIEDELRARPYGSRPDGYSTHCPNYEPVGMDGRNDWFRWNCRECGKKYISQRSEKSQNRYQCVECDAWHFVYSGFFDSDKETKPLTPDECHEDLYHAECAENEWGDAPEFYGGMEYICDKIEGDYFDIERVWLVTGDGEILVQQGEVSSREMKDATLM
jgi:hypothetical protein